jgi:type I restriction enzyme S subunit
MEVKNGYKQTEVGIIPEEWDVDTLGPKTLKVGSGITPTGGEKVYKEEGRPFLRSQNIGWGKLLLEDVAFIDDETHETFNATEIRDKDVFLNITGASIGRSAVANESVVNGNVNQHVCIIRTIESHLNPYFLNYFLLSSAGQKQIDSFQAGGNRQGLNFGQIKSFKIPLPLSSEQTTIAIALGDMDELINSLEKLIAKKRNIKQGTMQLLLNGRKRLPGFKDKWDVKELGEISNLKNGYAFKSSTYNENGEYLVITIANVQDGYMDISECSKILELPADIQSHQILQRGDLLVSMTGNVGRVCKVNVDNTLLNQRVGKFITYDIDVDFFFYLLNDRKFLNKMVLSAQGGAQGNISKDDILKYETYVPKDKLEQIAIAQVLSDMDSEISALEARLEKYTMIKQGMMQELLTGKTRII